MAQRESMKEADWARVFADWRKSDESQRGYCRREGISFSAFGYWRRKIDRQPADAAPVRLALSDEYPSWKASAGVTVRCGALRVELTGGESEKVLGRIFRALGSVGCS